MALNGGGGRGIGEGQDLIIESSCGGISLIPELLPLSKPFFKIPPTGYDFGDSVIQCELLVVFTCRTSRSVERCHMLSKKIEIYYYSCLW